MDYRARFYSQSLGRFIQPDTIIPNPSSPQSWNRYSYVLNSPVNLNDPSGHESGDMCDRGYRSCELETYTRAGIDMVSPYGNSRPRKPVLFFTYFWDQDYKNRSIGPAAVTETQIETERGKPIIDPRTGEVRSVGLGLRDHPCTVDGCDMDQNDSDVAVMAMRIRISLRLDACVESDCTDTDMFLAAILAADEKVSPDLLSQALDGKYYMPGPNVPDTVTMDWGVYIDTEHDPAQISRMILLFSAKALDLEQQGYYLPNVDWNYIMDLVYW